MTQSNRGFLLGLMGVAIFSLTLPLTRIAVTELNPLFLSIGRTVIAAMVAIPALVLTKQAKPSREDIWQLLIIAMGIVLGFPILSALAMQTVPAAHGGVVLGALPLATALMGIVFAGERPSLAFWLWSILGSLTVIIFALSDGATSLHSGDLFLLGALLAAAIGYAAGGNLSRKLGGWQVICWALVVALPVTLPLSIYVLPQQPAAISVTSWSCFLYVALMSQLVGFFFWNVGLAIGGVARVGQVQLLQIFFTLAAAAVINREPLTLHSVGFGVIVAICVWFGRKAKIKVAGTK